MIISPSDSPIDLADAPPPAAPPPAKIPITAPPNPVTNAPNIPDISILPNIRAKPPVMTKAKTPSPLGLIKILPISPATDIKALEIASITGWLPRNSHMPENRAPSLDIPSSNFGPSKFQKSLKTSLNSFWPVVKPLIELLTN